jgi:hypothetical protein
VLPNERFQRAALKLAQRKSRGNVDNDAGLFVHLLRVEFREHAKEVAAARAAMQPAAPEPSSIDKLRDDPARYVEELGHRLPEEVLAEILVEIAEPDLHPDLLARAAELRKAA